MSMIKDDDLVLFTCNEVADIFDVTNEWLKYNRRGNNPIPFVRAGYKTVLYKKDDIYKWIGRKDLALRFYSTKTVAKKLGFTDVWVRRNRLSQTPIPYRNIGGIIRYNKTEVDAWLKKWMKEKIK